MSEDSYPLEANLTDAFAQYCVNLRYSDLPERTRRSVRMLYLDYVAAVHAGFIINESFNDSVMSVLSPAESFGNSSVFFLKEKTSATKAAFLNAMLAHGADMDDGHKGAAGHVGAHVVSALMAVAEARTSNIADFVAAMVAGYDVFCRLSSACMPGMVHRGFHSTGTAGAIASAAAVAKLIGLDIAGVRSAIALSSTQAAGLLLVGETSQEVKPLSPARAAEAGVLSALLAECGVVGPDRPLESAKGWCHAMSSVVDTDLLFDGLGERYSIDECYLKPYPTCRHTHGCIEAASSLSFCVEASDMECISIFTYGHPIALAGFNGNPRNASEAKFSIQYAVAVALCAGTFTLDNLNVENITQEVRRLMAIVELIRDDSYEEPQRGIRGCRLEVVLNNGDMLTRSVLAPKGEPENPFTYEDMMNKLQSCLVAKDGRVVSRKCVEQFAFEQIKLLNSPESPFVFPIFRESASNL